MKDIKIKTDKLHEKCFIDTWQYNKTILKRFVVICKIKYLPGGGNWSKSIEVAAYDEFEACKQAFKVANIRPDDKIISMQPVACNTLNDIDKNKLLDSEGIKFLKKLRNNYKKL